MSALWKKLQWKEGVPVWISGIPNELEDLLSELTPSPRSHAEAGDVSFLLVFVTSRHDISRGMERWADRLKGDAILWFAYPKASSKRYTCDFNRDSGWEPLGKAGWEGVRQVAINEDWSALRFRKVEYIARLTRQSKMALSDEGKKRARS